MKRKIYTVRFRRKREGKTNYKSRIKLLQANKSRLVIRRSLNNLTLQIIDYRPAGDIVKVSAHTSELSKLGWKFRGSNIPSSYLGGLLLAVKAKKKNVAECVLDMGLNKNVQGSRIYAALKGVSDGGLKIPFSKDILPSDERISGQHIKKFAEMLKKDEARYNKQFSDYIKKGVNPLELPKQIEEIKNKIMKM